MIRRQLGLAVEVGEQRVGPCRGVDALPDMRVEVAIRAFRPTKRPMDVDRQGWPRHRLLALTPTLPRKRGRESVDTRQPPPPQAGGVIATGPLSHTLGTTRNIPAAFRVDQNRRSSSHGLTGALKRLSLRGPLGAFQNRGIMCVIIPEISARSRGALVLVTPRAGRGR